MFTFFATLLFLTPIKLGVPAFSPKSIPNLVLWLDAKNAGSITKDGSNNVSQWNDLSGNSNNATAAGANQPVYDATAFSGQPTMTQAGNPQCMKLTNTLSNMTQFDVFVMGYSHTAGAGSRQAFLGNEPSGEDVEFTPTFSLAINAAAGGAGAAGVGLLDTPYRVEYYSGAVPADFQLLLNGASQTVVTGDPAWQLSLNRIGCRADNPLWGINGGYSAVLVYSRALSPSERSDLNTYLLNEWGI